MRAGRASTTLRPGSWTGMLELEDNAFDVSGSQFGVMLFPNLPRA